MADQTEQEHRESPPPPPPSPTPMEPDYRYLDEDVLLTHIKRQSRIVQDSVADRLEIPIGPGELASAMEREMFAPRVPPKRESSGVCEPNPRINFYPTFMVPESLATYHIFFLNHKIPASCRANRTRADETLRLRHGAEIPRYSPVSEVSRIFEGLGDGEEPCDSAKLQEERDSVLVELKGDNPRLAVVKRFSSLTHFAYPAVNLPPKIMETVMDTLVMKRAKGASTLDEVDEDAGKPVVSDRELESWLTFPDGADEERRASIMQDRRKDMTAVTLVTTLLECMSRFFSHPDIVRKVGESIHYAFAHGYVGLASKTSNVNLSNLVSYMGILHENRLGQSVLHSTLEGEAKRDYIRDTIYLMLIHAWQTGMGIWQQCLEKDNLRELEKILTRHRRDLWSGFDEQTIAVELADIIMPERLSAALRAGLPDLVSQSMMQNFRSLILERSGILPAVSNALPSDFVPLTFRESPPPLWPYVFLFRLANYFMYHTDVSVDVSGDGLLEHYCRCNLCTPHRCPATNPSLLNEMQLIGTFEIQGPKQFEQEQQLQGRGAVGLKLTAGMWTSAFLRKFVPEDFHAHSISFYEDQSRAPRVAPSACVITQEKILGQLQDIKKAREEFLLKKGHGVYIDPLTGEQLNSATATTVAADPAADPSGRRKHAKSDTDGRGRRERERHPRDGDPKRAGRGGGGSHRGRDERGGGGLQRRVLLQRGGGGGRGASNSEAPRQRETGFQMG